jgi:hypothetical protein
LCGEGAPADVVKDVFGEGMSMQPDWAPIVTAQKKRWFGIISVVVIFL